MNQQTHLWDSVYGTSLILNFPWIYSFQCCGIGILVFFFKMLADFIEFILSNTRIPEFSQLKK